MQKFKLTTTGIHKAVKSYRIKLAKNKRLNFSSRNVALVAVVGVGFIVIGSLWALNSTSIEAESGIISTNVTIAGDANASKGQFIKFTGTTTGGSAPAVGRDNTCALSGLVMAFCDSFSVASTTNAPTDRSGDLNSVFWGVSRFSVGDSGQLDAWAPATMTTPCNGTTMVSPPRDVQICNGRLYDAVFDNHGQTVLAMYPKQPFDFAGRTGTIVFDVNSDSQGPHAAWPEFWLTDKPVPTPKGELTTQGPYAGNSLGVTFETDDGDCPSGQTGVRTMGATRNYQFEFMAFTKNACITKGSATGQLNHFKIEVSQSQVKVYGTDPGVNVSAGANWKLIATATNANLSFTRGLVWIEDVHYNACKLDTQCDHIFAWDNVGFDGPSLYRDLTFDVPDNSPNNLGYNMPVTVNVPNVHTVQTPTAAYVLFNWWSETQNVPSVQLNGNPVITMPWPFDSETFEVRTIAVPVPLSQVNIGGTNTLKIIPGSGEGHPTVGSINLLLVAGAPVPQ